MRIVFTVVALTGLIGLSIGDNETTEVAGLDLSNIELTVADFPGAEPSPKVETVFSPFEKTALWAVGLFVTESPVDALEQPEHVDVSYVDLSSQMPDMTHVGAHSEADIVK